MWFARHSWDFSWEREAGSLDSQTVLRVDLNCDTGETFSFQRPEGEELFKFITSANIACGFHAGDPVRMAKTVKTCLEHGVQLGAHPGLPDIMGFGRRNIDISPEELEYYLLYQLGALSCIANYLGCRVKHVKLHGALYNMVAKNESLSLKFIETLEKIDRELIVVVPFASITHKVALDKGARVAVEAFADRAYDENGALVSRSVKGAVISDPDLVIKQVADIVKGEIKHD
jgi:UPF0271 protein